MQAESLNGTKISICSHVKAMMTCPCVIALTSTVLAKPVCQCQSTSTQRSASKQAFKDECTRPVPKDFRIIFYNNRATLTKQE